MRAWIASKGVRRTEPEYELRDALGRSGCAICRLALRTAARQLDILSYENVNDLDLRARLRDARGFCNRHAWQLLEQTRDPLGVALIYKDVINTLVPELRLDGSFDKLIARLRGRRTSGLAGRLAATRECPICLAERETEDVYLRLLGARIAEPSFRDAWKKSSGLCWLHLLECLLRARSDDALELLGQSPSLLQKPEPPGEAGTDPPPHLPSPRGKGEQQGEAERAAESPIHMDDCQDEGRDSISPLPPQADQGEGNYSVIRALALTHGRWSADRYLLPPDLVVDLQQRRLEVVTRPAGDRRPECYACQEAAEGMERRIGGTLSEGVTAEMLAETCERHAWQLASRGAEALTLPLAALGEIRRRALAEALERAQAERPTVTAPGQPASAWIGERAGALLRATRGRPSVGCTLCGQEDTLDREVTTGAVGMRRPVALCRVHMSDAANLPDHPPHWTGLLAHQASRWRHLSLALADFIRKHDYRFSREPRGEERDSPWLAVEEVAGRKGMA